MDGRGNSFSEIRKNFWTGIFVFEISKKFLDWDVWRQTNFPLTLFVFPKNYPPHILEKGTDTLTFLTRAVEP